MTVIWLLWLPFTLAAPKIFPLVDPGLFVISGVKTCGGGGGYCLLGLDCTLDEDFLPDTGVGQHCEGLKSAFTPSAHFVCCRATNRTGYKPPLAMATTHPEPMTARTTTLNILENEIDQVLQKVAQSVNSVKKSPVTEATLPISDDNDDSEIHESAEADEEEGGIEEVEEEMVADSPLEMWQDISSEDDDDEKDKDPGVLEDKNGTKVLVESNEPENDSSIMMFSYDQTPKIEEYIIEKNPEENTVSSLDILNGTVKEENSKSSNANIEKGNVPQESVTNKDNTLDDDSLNTTAQEGPQDTNDTIYNNKEESPIYPQETTDNLKNISALEDEIPHMSTSMVSKLPTQETTLLPTEDPLTDDQHNETPEDPIPSSKENVEDILNSPVIPTLDTKKKVSSEDNLTNISKETETTNLKLSENDIYQENIDLSQNEDPNSTIVDDENQLEPDIMVKENDSQVHNEQAISDTKSSENTTEGGEKLLELGVMVKEHDSQMHIGSEFDDTKSSKNATESDGSQSVTATTMLPELHLSNAIQPSEIQTQPESTDPCAKVTDGKCTQEVKFVSNDQTLCFGSVYALDWVVTSASCALRIFRAGTPNVIVSPLTEMSKGHVKTIVVHESYAENSGSSGQGMEPNNIGLVQLHTPMVEWSRCVPCLPETDKEFPGINCSVCAAGLVQLHTPMVEWSRCVPCLPETDKEFTGINCSAVTSQPLAPSPLRLCAQSENCEMARSQSTMNSCDGPSRMMTDDIGYSYITLNCDILWEPRFYDPSSRGSGAPLFCDGGVLAGVETGAGVGLMVYTPLTPYIPWLLKNTRPGPPEQTFNVG
ncbi:uncharacterized protein LOC129001348 [Macrosteles quadrilineatus]|uniref:uncharacterized protein LOC129001348 n=1 Tax=Macrosteles quadrilineatus TaxID=74068 RepID=UPI0023E2600D|nr:uncharacterized protein LOC129001348 [Macrosteles quadrilineatus]